MIRRGFIGTCLAALGFSLNTVTVKADNPKEIVQGVATELLPYKRSRPRVLRLWKLGSLEHNIFPTDATYQKLADILQGWDGESDLDLIWDGAIECQQFVIGDEDVDAIPNIRIIREGEYNG